MLMAEIRNITYSVSSYKNEFSLLDAAQDVIRFLPLRGSGQNGGGARCFCG